MPSLSLLLLDESAFLSYDLNAVTFSFLRSKTSSRIQTVSQLATNFIRQKKSFSFSYSVTVGVVLISVTISFQLSTEVHQQKADEEARNVTKVRHECVFPIYNER